MSIGPRVAFVDDIENQITPLENVAKELHAGTVFFNANPEYAVFPDSPIETVKLLFLDLFYKKDFDAELSAQWVETIIPAKAEYDLVIWSKDTDESGALLEILETIDRKPSTVNYWQKNNYTDAGVIKDEVGKLTVNLPLYEPITQEDFMGEIVDVTEDGVLITCRISLELPAFEIRKFDTELVGRLSKVEKGIFVRITIYTKAGARLITILEEKQDKSQLFDIEDYLGPLKDTPFFLGE